MPRLFVVFVGYYSVGRRVTQGHQHHNHDKHRHNNNQGSPGEQQLHRDPQHKLTQHLFKGESVVRLAPSYWEFQAITVASDVPAGR